MRTNATPDHLATSKPRFCVSSCLAMGLGSLVAIQLVGASGIASAQESPGFYTDPATGIVYRRVTRTVEQPVVETKMTQRQQTVYTPKAIVETTPTVRQTYTPVVEYRWKPKLEGRWNPFRQPTVAYEHVPETRWQQRSEVVSQTKTRVEWQPETKTVAVPQQIARIERKQQVDFEPVGRVAPPAASTGVRPEIASRLRPLAPNTSVSPMGGSAYASSSATNTNTLATRERPRSTLQSGLRATELGTNPVGAYGTPMGGMPTSVAGLPPVAIWR